LTSKQFSVSSGLFFITFNFVFVAEKDASGISSRRKVDFYFENRAVYERSKIPNGVELTHPNIKLDSFFLLASNIVPKFSLLDLSFSW
jgi:hypothetical protein